MDEEQRQKIEAAAQLHAIKYQLAHVYNMVLRLYRADEESIQTSEQQGRERVGLQAIDIGDPAMSDYVIGEVQDALLELQKIAREMRA